MMMDVTTIWEGLELGLVTPFVLESRIYMLQNRSPVWPSITFSALYELGLSQTRSHM